MNIKESEVARVNLTADAVTRIIRGKSRSLVMQSFPGATDICALLSTGKRVFLVVGEPYAAVKYPGKDRSRAFDYEAFSAEPGRKFTPAKLMPVSVSRMVLELEMVFFRKLTSITDAAIADTNIEPAHGETHKAALRRRLAITKRNADPLLVLMNFKVHRGNISHFMATPKKSKTKATKKCKD